MGALQPDRPIPVVEGAAAMMELPLRIELTEGIAHAEGDLGLYIQCVVDRVVKVGVRPEVDLPERRR